MRLKISSIAIILLFLAVGSIQAQIDFNAPAVDVDVLHLQVSQAVNEAIQSGEFDRALLIIDNARIKGLPIAQAHLLKATVYGIKGDRASQEAQLRGAIFRDPNLVEPHLRLAEQLELQGLWSEAIAEYRLALNINPDYANAYLSIARLLQEQQRNGLAREVLHEGVQAVPDDADLALALGEACERQGDYEIAREQFERAVSLATGKGRQKALRRLAGLALATGDPQTAFITYQTVIDEGAPVTRELYVAIVKSVDEVFWPELQTLGQSIDPATGAESVLRLREDVFNAGETGLAILKAMTQFMDTLDVPDDFRTDHVKRRYALGLGLEALTTGMAYLDTGDPELLEMLRSRLSEASRARRLIIAVESPLQSR